MALAAILALLGWSSYEGYGTFKTQALRDRLLNADTIDVPAIVADMTPFRHWINPLLREAYQEAEESHDARKQLHTSLALLPVDPNQKEFLYNRLLDAKPHEVPVLRDALLPHEQELQNKLWAVVEQPAKGQERQRLHAACALATYEADDQRWQKVSRPVVNQLVAENPVFLGHWLEGFRPVKGKLLAALANVFRDARRRETERTLATNILADYAADQPRMLADLLMDADDKQFAVLFPRLADQREQGLSVLLGEVDRRLPLEAKEDEKERLAQRQANAGVALLRLGWAERAWPLLRHSPDPGARSYLIHRLSALGADARAVARRLDEEPNVTIRRALVLSLGEFGEKEYSPAERALMVEKLRNWYREDPDPGLHAAAGWLLLQWKQGPWLKQVDEAWAKDRQQREQRLARIRQEMAKEHGKAQPHWYVNGQGQTMVIVPGPVEFLMGSPTTEADRVEDERRHRRRIGRVIAIAATAVTVEQFRRFRPEFSHGEMRRYPEPTCPIGGVTWYEGAEYCNWLSAQEGLPKQEWCYEPNKDDQFAEGMKLAPDYLQRLGYRLPTEAEWECACRAGAVTSRYYGEAEELLRHYGWYQGGNAGQRTWPVGGKKPNDWGLYDMHGNVWCWCQDSYKGYDQARGGEALEDNEDIIYVDNQAGRVLRGGSFDRAPLMVRSASRMSRSPANRINDYGFRPARTIR
jgi:formylglycine-generating enzyme required for sulfatase activity